MADNGNRHPWLIGRVLSVDEAKGYLTVVEHRTGAEIVIAGGRRPDNWAHRALGDSRRPAGPGAVLAIYGATKAGRSDSFYVAEHGAVLATADEGAQITVVPSLLKLNQAKDKDRQYLEARVLDAQGHRIQGAGVRDAVMAALAQDDGLAIPAARRGFILRTVVREDTAEPSTPYATRSASFFGRQGQSPDAIWAYHSQAKGRDGRQRIQAFLDHARKTLSRPGVSGYVEAVGFSVAFVDAPQRYLSNLSSRSNFSLKDADGRTIDAYSLCAVVVAPDSRGRPSLRRVQPLPKAERQVHRDGLLGSHLPGATFPTRVDLSQAPVPNQLLDAAPRPAPSAGAAPSAPARPRAPAVGATARPLRIEDQLNPRTRRPSSFTIIGSAAALATYRERITGAAPGMRPLELAGGSGYNFPVAVRSAVSANLSDLLGTPPLYVNTEQHRTGEVCVVRGRLDIVALRQQVEKAIPGYEATFDPTLDGIAFPAEHLIRLNAQLARINHPLPLAAPVPQPAPAPQAAPERAPMAPEQPAGGEASRPAPPPRLSFYGWMEREFGGNPRSVVDRYASEFMAEAEAAGIDGADALAKLDFAGPRAGAPKIKCRPISRKDAGSVVMFPYWHEKRDEQGQRMIWVRVTFLNAHSFRGQKFEFDPYEQCHADYQQQRGLPHDEDVAARAAAEREARLAARAEEAAKERAKELADKRQSLLRWHDRYTRLPAAEGDAPYLVKKGITAIAGKTRGDGRPVFDLRVGSDEQRGPYLIAPLTDGHGNWLGAQQIFDTPWTEDDGRSINKKTIFGSQFEDESGEPTGAHLQCGELENGSQVFIGEGVADIATIWLTTGRPAVGATGTANLAHVARRLREQLPSSRLVIVADNDGYDPGKGNPGVFAALNAAFTHQVDYVVPDFKGLPRGDRPTDINDLHQLAGADTVRDQLARPRPAPASALDHATLAVRVVGLRHIGTWLDDRVAELTQAEDAPAEEAVLRPILRSAIDAYGVQALNETLGETRPTVSRLLTELRVEAMAADARPAQATPEAAAEPEEEERSPASTLEPEAAPDAGHPVTVAVETGATGKKYTAVRYRGEDAAVVADIEQTLDRLQNRRLPFNATLNAWVLPAPLMNRARCYLHRYTGAAPLYIGSAASHRFIMGDFSDSDLRRKVQRALRFVDAPYVSGVGGFRIETPEHLPYIEQALLPLLRPDAGDGQALATDIEPPQNAPEVVAAARAFNVTTDALFRANSWLNFVPEAGVVRQDDYAFAAAYAAATSNLNEAISDPAARHQAAMDGALRLIRQLADRPKASEALGEAAVDRLHTLGRHITILRDLEAGADDAPDGALAEALEQTGRRFGLHLEDTRLLVSGADDRAELRARQTGTRALLGRARVQQASGTEVVQVLSAIDPAEVATPEGTPAKEEEVKALVYRMEDQVREGLWFPESAPTAILRADGSTSSAAAAEVEAARRGGVRIALWRAPLSMATDQALTVREVSENYRLTALHLVRQQELERIVDPDAAAIAATLRDGKAIDDHIRIDDNAERRLDKLAQLIAFGIQQRMTEDEIFEHLVLGADSPYRDPMRPGELAPQLQQDFRYASASRRYPAITRIHSIGQLYDLLYDKVSEQRIQQLREHIDFFLRDPSGERGRTFKTFYKFWRDPDYYGPLPADAPRNPYGTEDWSSNEALKRDLALHTPYRDHEDKDAGSLVAMFEAMEEASRNDMPASLSLFDEPEPDAPVADEAAAGVEEDAGPAATEPAVCEDILEETRDEKSARLMAFRHGDAALYEVRLDHSVRGGALTDLQCFIYHRESAEQLYGVALHRNLATARDLSERLAADADVVERYQAGFRDVLLVKISEPGETPLFAVTNAVRGEQGEVALETDSLWVDQDAARGRYTEITGGLKAGPARAPTESQAERSQEKAIARLFRDHLKAGTAPDKVLDALRAQPGLKLPETRIELMRGLYENWLRTENPEAYKAAMGVTEPTGITGQGLPGPARATGTPQRLDALMALVERYVDACESYSEFYADLWQAGGAAAEENPYRNPETGELQRASAIDDLRGLGYSQLRDLYEARFREIHHRRSDDLDLARQGGFVPAAVEQEAPLQVQFAALAAIADVDTASRSTEHDFEAFAASDDAALIFHPILAEDLASVEPETLAARYETPALQLLADIHGIQVAPAQDLERDPEACLAAAREIVEQHRLREELLALDESEVATLDRESMASALERLGLPAGGTPDALAARLRRNIERVRHLSDLRRVQGAFLCACLAREAQGNTLTRQQRADVERICSSDERHRELLREIRGRSEDQRRLEALRDGLRRVAIARSVGEQVGDDRAQPLTVAGARESADLRPFKDRSTGEADLGAQLKYEYGALTPIKLADDELPAHITYHGRRGRKVLAVPLALSADLQARHGLYPINAAASAALLEADAEWLMASRGSLTFHSPTTGEITVVLPAPADGVTVSRYSHGELQSTRRRPSLGAALAADAATLGDPADSDRLIRDHAADLAASNPLVVAARQLLGRAASIPSDDAVSLLEEAEQLPALEDVLLRHDDKDPAARLERALESVAVLQARYATAEMIGLASDVDREGLDAFLTRCEEAAATPAQGDRPKRPFTPLFADTLAVASERYRAFVAGELPTEERAAIEEELARVPQEAGDPAQDFQSAHRYLVERRLEDGSEAARRVAEQDYPELVDPLPTADSPEVAMPRKGMLVYAEVAGKPLLGRVCEVSEQALHIDTSRNALATSEALTREHQRRLFDQNGAPLFGMSEEAFRATDAARRAPGSHFRIQPVDQAGLEALGELPLEELQDLVRYVNGDPEQDRADLLEEYALRWNASEAFAGQNVGDVVESHLAEELSGLCKSLQIDAGSEAEQAAALVAWAEETIEHSAAYCARRNWEITERLAESYGLAGEPGTPAAPVAVPLSAPRQVIAEAGTLKGLLAPYETARELAAATAAERLPVRATAYAALAAVADDPEKVRGCIAALPADQDLEWRWEGDSLAWTPVGAVSDTDPGEQSLDAALEMLASNEDVEVLETIDAGQRVCWVIPGADRAELHQGVADEEVGLTATDLSEGGRPVQVRRGEGRLDVPAGDLVVISDRECEQRLDDRLREFSGTPGDLLEAQRAVAEEAVMSGRYREAAWALLLCETLTARLHPVQQAIDTAPDAGYTIRLEQGQISLCNHAGGAVASFQDAAAAQDFVRRGAPGAPEQEATVPEPTPEPAPEQEVEPPQRSLAI